MYVNAIKKLIIGFLVLCIAGAACAMTSTSISLHSTVTIGTSTSLLKRGLNYLSLYNEYSSNITTDSVLRRDFSRFQNDGINVISLSLYWYRLEGDTMGDYNGTYPDGSPYGDVFLENVKAVMNVANQYGIKVLVTIHTVFGNESSWCTPDYVIDPTTGENDEFAIVRSDEMKQAFVSMVNHTVSYLSGIPNICAWAILNEPWYYHDLDAPRGNLHQKDNFIDLIQQLSRIAKTLDGRPVTVRFVNGHTSIDSNGVASIRNNFVYDWSWDQRIIDALDFICLNDYMPAFPEINESWRNITINNIMECMKLGKKVWITECGFPPSRFDFVQGANDDTTQADNYRTFMTFYKMLPINTVLAWYWRSDSAISDPGNIGSGRNLCANVAGDPRPAYYKLIG